MPLDKELLDILVCPKTHAKLVEVGDWLYSTDREALLKYPIREGIPVLLIEEAESISAQEFEKVVGARQAAKAD